ncbi:MAG: HlyD family secretion protein, partial [Lachnospirales bacterium]
MKKKIVIPIVAALCIVTAGGIYIKASQTETQVEIPMERTISLTTTATKGDISSSITASGTVGISSTNTQYSGSASTIAEVYFEVGDTVKKGDVILKYDTDETIKSLEKSIRETQISIENAQNNLTDLVAPLSTSEEISYEENITSKEKSIVTAQENYDNLVNSKDDQYTAIENAKKEMEKAQKEMENYKALYEAGSESAQTYNNYVTTYENAVQSYESSQKALTTLENEILSAEKEITAAEQSLSNTKTLYEIAQDPLSDSSVQSQYKQQENSLELLNLELQELQDELANMLYEVVAEEDGTILTLNATKNGSVQEGNALFTYTDYNKLVVTSSVSQYEIADVYEGQNVK